MKGVTFGTYHSYDDFNLLLTSKEVAAPKVKTIEIDVPGADGALDLTEMMFQTRSGSAALLWAFSANANNAKLYVPQAYIIRPVTAASVNGNINIIAKGKV